MKAEPSGAGVVASTALTAWQPPPVTLATSSRVCGAACWTCLSTAAQVAGTVSAGCDSSAASSRPLIRPWASTLRVTVSGCPLSETARVTNSDVLARTASGRRVLTRANVAFSWAARDLREEDLIEVRGDGGDGTGGCAIAPSSQRAWAPGGVPGRVAAVVPAADAAAVELGGFCALPEQAAVALRIPAAASAAVTVRALFMVTPSLTGHDGAGRRNRPMTWPSRSKVTWPVQSPASKNSGISTTVASLAWKTSGSPIRS